MSPSSPDDPFAALEEAARRQEAEEKAAKAVSGARARLVLGRDARSAFFATLVLRLKAKADWSCETMATDGRSIDYNPNFTNGLTPDELVGVLIHETMHVAMAHHCRRQGRNPRTFNEAADLAVNQIIEQAGFTLPSCRLMVGEGKYAKFPREKSAEEYYRMLQEENEGGEGGDGGDPGGCGEVRDAGDPAEAADQEAEWETAVAQAEAAGKSRGELPAGLARVVGAVLRPAADWKSVLREFVSKHARSDYSWSRPNRRFVARGLYLPGRSGERLGEVVLTVDASGSVGPKELAVFANQAEAILSAFDCTATVLYHDAAVTNVQEWQSSDGPLVLEPVGGGGTDHRPVFDWIEREGRSPACVICLTDLETAFPQTPPETPVLWAVVGGRKATAPFGQVVNVE